VIAISVAGIERRRRVDLKTCEAVGTPLRPKKGPKTSGKRGENVSRELALESEKNPRRAQTREKNTAAFWRR